MKKSALLFCLIAFFLSSCRKDSPAGCFDSSGPVREQIRMIQPFRYLQVSDDVSVTWHDSSVTFLKLRCGRNLMNGVSTNQKGDHLEIRNLNYCNWVRRYDLPMEIDIWSPAPYFIRLEGYGKFRCADSLNSGLLTLQLVGSGSSEFLIAGGLLYCDFATIENSVIRGYADEGKYGIQKTGYLNASTLKMKKCELDMKGNNNARIWVSDSLWGKHSSEKDVFLKGSPKVKVSCKSSGRIMPDG